MSGCACARPLRAGWGGATTTPLRSPPHRVPGPVGRPPPGGAGLPTRTSPRQTRGPPHAHRPRRPGCRTLRPLPRCGPMRAAQAGRSAARSRAAASSAIVGRQLPARASRRAGGPGPGLRRRVLTVLALGQILGGLGTGATLALGALLIAGVSGNSALSGWRPP
ncbi:hypothetical protein QJS66_12075 [Kocuria rhizophila]|nr:hypothetical protein QJS66_12075 [Kocuria rhizophila]